ncbi:MAG TPA: hypothetical protein VHC63_18890 [Acidimicrobiales bacterium]|nr:hypothetical protein [Acidimicrobiales bacterium]
MEKALNDFMWSRKAEGKRDSYCRPCRAEYKKAHYAANKRRYLANATAMTKKLLDQRVMWLLDYFATHPCVDCGEADPIVLDFDHLRDKSFTISTALHYKSMKAILAEIEKCEVRCANCHRRRTARTGGFARVMFVGWNRLALRFGD